MKRAQIYLIEDLWKALHIQSRQQGLSIPELVRQAIRDKYGNSAPKSRQAMEALVGMWKDREDLPDSTEYVRRLREGKRLRRIHS
jgi:endonuclease YncB( thermonuclease family)